ncbi:hypothetical protein [Nocardiopsis sp. CNT312]|uniref:hypothetical protein n=1 Tax=Nocardiopsis sp. CNT312 TaxID=1137268 RepID=UPI00048B48CB|nr:hypothetical protein [Nocardiopsis sp. CNT312]
MRRIAKISGIALATGLALGALSAPASADNNSDVQNITIPICADVLQFAGISADGCNVVDWNESTGIHVD